MRGTFSETSTESRHNIPTKSSFLTYPLRRELFPSDVVSRTVPAHESVERRPTPARLGHFRRTTRHPTARAHNRNVDGSGTLATGASVMPHGVANRVTFGGLVKKPLTTAFMPAGSPELYRVSVLSSMNRSNSSGVVPVTLLELSSMVKLMSPM